MKGLVAQRIQAALAPSPRASKFWDQVQDNNAADLQAMREEIAAAVGFYDCPCGGHWELFADATVKQYGALQRWLGHHGRCGEPDDSEDRESYAAAMGVVNGLRS